MSTWWCQVLCILSIISESVGDKYRKGIEKNVPERLVPNNTPQLPPNEDVYQRNIGSTVKVQHYQPTPNLGPAASPNDLSCNFNQGAGCCWTNAKPPDDTMEWNLASGTSEQTKIQKAFGSTDGPSGSFLTVATERASNPTGSALFVSCKIVCTNDPVKVSLRHWASQNVQLQICSRTVASNQLTNCVPVTGPPGPTTAAIPPGENIQIVISASNFISTGDSLAIVDDITVDFTPCPATTTPLSPTEQTMGPTTVQLPGPTTPPVPATDECQTVVCDFEQGSPCSYTDTSSDAHSDYYAASYLKPKDTTVLVTKANFGDDRVIKFDYYKATHDVTLDVCCDNIDSCLYKADHKATVNDFRVWHTGSIQCPKNTQKVIFYSENNGLNEGAVGLDNIRLYSVDQNQLCGTPSEGGLSVINKKKKKTVQIH